MKNPDDSLPPPMLLAIAYAPVAVRMPLRWLLTLDQKLFDLSSRAREPMIAQLRLSWWRDALKSVPESRPKGEPLLMALQPIEPDAALITASLALIDVYENLTTGSDLQEQAIAKKQRVSAICDAYSDWSGYGAFGDSRIETLVVWWTNPVGSIPKSLPRICRPLSILALAEHMETSHNQRLSLRLNWHALTGR
jgi:15-cis-phytoene synthase